MQIHFVYVCNHLKGFHCVASKAAFRQASDIWACRGMFFSCWPPIPLILLAAQSPRDLVTCSEWVLCRPAEEGESPEWSGENESGLQHDKNPFTWRNIHSTRVRSSSVLHYPQWTSRSLEDGSVWKHAVSSDSIIIFWSFHIHCH